MKAARSGAASFGAIVTGLFGARLFGSGHGDPGTERPERMEDPDLSEGVETALNRLGEGALVARGAGTR